MQRFAHNSPAYRSSKTLAVLSCALALLAAHPLAAHAMRAAPPAAVVLQPSPAPSAPDSSLTLRLATPEAALPAPRPLRTVRRDPITPSRESHVFATLERLGRMLILELAPQLTPDLVPCFGRLAVDTPRPASHPAVALTRQGDLPPPVERTFALRHALLAPPV